MLQRPTDTKRFAVRRLVRPAIVGLCVLIGCERPTPPANDDNFVPFAGADVVRPDTPPQDLPAEQFVVEQFKQYASQMPATICAGKPEVLWLEGQPPHRQGMGVILMVRADVYRKTQSFHLKGPTVQVLTDLMKTVGGQVINAHRIPANSTAQVDLASASVAQAAYVALRSANLSGRIVNSNRWVICSFKETDAPLDAFRPMFDQLWEDVDSLRESQPVLSVGEQVLGEDDLRLKRLYQKAGRPLSWPSHAGSAPDPGLQFGPATTRP